MESGWREENTKEVLRQYAVNGCRMASSRDSSEVKTFDVGTGALRSRGGQTDWEGG